MDDSDWRGQLVTALFTPTGSSRFASGGVLPPALLASLRLRVVGLADILACPLGVESAQRLIELASPAPFGQRDKTKHDTKVRLSFQLDPTQVSVPVEWLEALHAHLFTRLNDDLALRMRAPEELAIQFYKLLLYPRGGHFTRHRDTEKEAGMFGTLVVVLPSAYDGGALLIHQGECVKAFDFAEDIRRTPAVHYAAFFADCEHELKTVTQGHRIALAFNLVRRDSRPALGKLEPTRVESVTSALRAWLAEDGGGPFAIRLEHRYTEAHLTASATPALKGTDADVQALLLAAAARLDNDGAAAESPAPTGASASSAVPSDAAPAAAATSVSVSTSLLPPIDDGDAEPPAPPRLLIYPCQLKVEESGYFEDEMYERGRQIEERDVVASQFPPSSALHHALGGSDGPKLPIDDDHIVARPGELTAREEFEKDDIEHTGNEGTTFKRWYHMGALAVIDSRCVIELMARHATSRAISLFREAVRALRSQTPTCPLPDTFPSVLRSEADVCALGHAIVQSIGDTSFHQMASFASALLALLTWQESTKQDAPAGDRVRATLRALLTSRSLQGSANALAKDQSFLQFLHDVAMSSSLGIAAVRGWLHCAGTRSARPSYFWSGIHSGRTFYTTFAGLWHEFVRANGQMANIGACEAIAQEVESATLDQCQQDLRRLIQPADDTSSGPAAVNDDASSVSPAASAARLDTPDSSDEAMPPFEQVDMAPPSSAELERLCLADAFAWLECLYHTATNWSRVHPWLAALTHAVISKLATYDRDMKGKTRVSSSEWVRDTLAPALCQIYLRLASSTRSQQSLQSHSPMEIALESSSSSSSSAAAAASAPAHAAVTPTSAWQSCLLELHDCAIAHLAQRLAASPLPPVGGEWCFDNALVRLAQFGSGCTCDDCRAFTRFLTSGEQQFELQAIEKRRKHINNAWRISNTDECGLHAETIHTSNPHQLVVRKTRSALEMRHARNMEEVSRIAELTTAWPIKPTENQADPTSFLPYTTAEVATRFCYMRASATDASQPAAAASSSVGSASKRPRPSAPAARVASHKKKPKK